MSTLATRGKLTEVSLAQAKATDLLSADEVAELCGMTRGRVSQLLISGEMRGTKMRNLFWQVERREAEKFMEQPGGGGRPRSGS